MELYYFFISVLSIFVIIAGFCLTIKGFVRGVKGEAPLSLLTFWQLIPGVLITFCIACFVVRVLFPNSFWSDVFILCGPFSFAVGFLVGFFWPPRIAEEEVRKWYWLELVLFECAALLVTGASAPHALKSLKSTSITYKRQQHIDFFHSLNSGDISQIIFAYEPDDSVTITNMDKIDEFADFLNHARIAYLDESKIAEQIRISIDTKQGLFDYKAFVLFNKKEDIFLDPSSNRSDICIRLPGLKRWLDQNILKKEK